ncbi:MAG: DEAD/DEAH box helicase, partial [Alphaproteobacteria bacterium]|nr:DEAD/DEAH box helicase [Alphaproteobacteria bacterium]
MTQFNELGLNPAILKSLAAEGYTQPTPIQAQAIPHVMAGRDLLGLAQTGTGKTAAFALPILHRLAAERRRAGPGACRVLVLSPTRELASQIADSFRTYGRHLGLSVAVVFGGVGYGPQVQALARGLDVLVATPGRLLDHMESRKALLDQVETLVLDEADQMLDMGFIHAIRRILPKLPKERQTLFFSATMPREIDNLAAELLRQPARVAVTPVASTAERVAQRVILVEAGAKRELLARVLREEQIGRTLVFTRTKRGADRVADHLVKAGIPAAAIHGNKSQGQRERALGDFRKGRTNVLVATDIAARGIDVDGVTHVVNFELPNVPEAYVHRIGRTARAGAS